MKLNNPKYEAFAQAVAEGISSTRAYREHVSDRGSIYTATREASRLLNNPNVLTRVIALQQGLSDAIEKRLNFSKLHLAQYLLEIMETPVELTNKRSRLRERVSKMKGGGHSFGIPSKMKAAELLAEICGWRRPAEMNLNVPKELGELVARARKNAAKVSP
jgi:hypothetical protein